LKFFCDGKTTWPDRVLNTEGYHEFRRQQKASEKLHEIKLQNSLAKIFLGFFLLLLSISFVAFLAGNNGLGNGLLVIILLKSPLIGFCLYLIIKNKIKKRKLDFHMSNDSLSAMYDWDVCKCRQCGSSDFAEIISDIPDFSPELEGQINGDVVLRCAHHGNAALQCNGCGKWGYDRNKLDSNLVRNLDGENISGNCPNCNSTYYSKIIWGMPDPIAMEYHRERGDDVIWGGCCIPSDNPPDKSCNDCGHQYSWSSSCSDCWN
jgi:hypothetical protein